VASCQHYKVAASCQHYKVAEKRSATHTANRKLKRGVWFQGFLTGASYARGLLWIYLWLAETSQQPISQTTWLKVTPHCNH
jgi:hypothetical protein